MKLTNLTTVFVILLCALMVNAGILDHLDALKNNIINNFKTGNKKTDISFGGSLTSKLDVYYQENDTSNLKPVVIYIHGGAWFYGDKIKFTKMGDLLVEEGFVGVISNYILFPFGNFDKMFNDVYKTVEWTYKNIKKYGGDPNRIILSGHSAGAHLVALTTIKSTLRMENLNQNLSPLPRLEKLVLFSGPYDFDNYDNITKLLTNSEEEVDHGFVERLATVLFRSKNIGPTDILKKIGDGQLTDLGFPKVNFYYSKEDNIVP